MKTNRFNSWGIAGVAAVLSTAVLLGGCSQKPPAPASTALRAQWSYASSKSPAVLRQEAQCDLSEAGVTVFVQGNTVTIIMPDDILFATGSANLLDSSKSILYGVSTLLKTYSVVALKVSAYSDTAAYPGAPQNRKLGLTNQQANVVSSALWSHGIDMRLVTAKGYSSQHAVSWNNTPQGRNDNQRVEITFRFYPNNNDYS